MKRLIKLNETIQDYTLRNKSSQSIIDKYINDNSVMRDLDELNTSDVKNNRCPKCSYEPLERVNGYKVCKSCESIYKLLNGEGYIII